MALVYIVAAYLLGSIPVGVVLSKLKGQDPRKAGSGNIGATNVMRTAGKGRMRGKEKEDAIDKAQGNVLTQRSHETYAPFLTRVS